MSRYTESKNKLNWMCPERRLLAAATVAILMFAASCTKNEAAPPAPSRGVPVVVAKVLQRAMPVEVTSVGNVEPISTISIRPQVSGQLLEIHFKEGDFVRKGQLLLSIDPRPYQAQVD